MEVVVPGTKAFGRKWNSYPSFTQAEDGDAFVKFHQTALDSCIIVNCLQSAQVIFRTGGCYTLQNQLRAF